VGRFGAASYTIITRWHLDKGNRRTIFIGIETEQDRTVILKGEPGVLGTPECPVRMTIEVADDTPARDQDEILALLNACQRIIADLAFEDTLPCRGEQ
jgi:hypothetical protein